MAEPSVEIGTLDNDLGLATVKGFLDANTFEALDQSLQQLFGRSLYKIALDFSKLDYISSAGVGVIMGALNVAKANGGKIVVIESERETVSELGMTDKLLQFGFAVDQAE